MDLLGRDYVMNTVGAYEYNKLINKQYMMYITDISKLQFEFLIGRLGGSLEKEIPRFADIFEGENNKPVEKEEEPEEIIDNIRTKINFITNKKGESP